MLAYSGKQVLTEIGMTVWTNRLTAEYSSDNIESLQINLILFNVRFIFITETSISKHTPKPFLL
jgi:hypothetical protein